MCAHAAQGVPQDFNKDLVCYLVYMGGDVEELWIFLRFKYIFRQSNENTHLNKAFLVVLQRILSGVEYQFYFLPIFVSEMHVHLEQH